MVADRRRSHSLVEHLQTECRNHQQSAVVYYYCTFNDNVSCLDVLASFLDQLVLQAYTISHGTRQLFSKEKTRSRKSLTLDIVLAAFQEALTSFDVVYILVDALDEFSDLKTLMKQLAELQRSQAPQLRLLFTSQPHPHHVTVTVNDMSIPNANRINITEHDSDIPTYIHRFLHESVDLREFISDFPDLYEHIREKLLTKAENSFVLLSFSIGRS